jgi:hypothetical protein
MPDKTGRPQEWGLLIFGQGVFMGMSGFLAVCENISFFSARSSVLPRIQYAWQSLQLKANEPSVEISRQCKWSSRPMVNNIVERCRYCHAIVIDSVRKSRSDLLSMRSTLVF